MSLKQEVMLCVAFDTATATNSGELVPSCLKIMNRAHRAHLLEGAAPAETNTQPIANSERRVWQIRAEGWEVGHHGPRPYN